MLLQIVMVSPGTSIHLCVLRDACHELFCVFGDFYTSGMQDTEVRVSISFFFLFFEPIPILSYFKTKASYFSYFLAGEAKIVTKLKMEFLVVRLKSESYHKASSMLTLML